MKHHISKLNPKSFNEIFNRIEKKRDKENNIKNVYLINNDFLFQWLLNQEKRIIPLFHGGMNGIVIYFQNKLITSYKNTKKEPEHFIRIDLDPKFKPDHKFVQSCCYQVGKEKYLGKEFIDLYPDVKDKWTNRLKKWIERKLK